MLALDERFRVSRSAAVAGLDAMFRAAWESCDPALIELVRLRVATLTEHPGAGVRSPWIRDEQVSDAKIAHLPEWPVSDLFDQRERDCLAFTEQFVMDVGNCSDEAVAALDRHFDPDGVYAFVNAVYVMDFGLRLETVGAALFSGRGA